MENTKVENKGGILTSLDSKKAFDSLEWPLIHKTLETFNFGEVEPCPYEMGNFILFQHRECGD